MFQRRSGLLSILVIFFGLTLTVWWMYSAEETVSNKSNKVSFNKEDLSLRSVTPPIVIKTKSEETTNPVIQARKLSELQEILDSKNDNDPRLDSDFKTLNDSEKKALQEKYLSYVPEKLNERGTLIFLLGRNIQSEKDLQFMGHVLNEKPCLSMADCSNAGAKATGEAEHLASVDAITLAYPQVVTIKSIENLLSANQGNQQLRPLALKNLQEATHSSSPIVAHLAASTLRKISP